MSVDYSPAVHTARDYYNSDDADRFYYRIWGGEDIHIGWYQSADEEIGDASRRTVVEMADRLNPTPTASSHIVDLGSGYGGAARYLAQRFGCRVTAINLAEAENERHRRMNAEHGLEDRIDVVDGNFESVACDDASADVVWSQDAILHSSQRDRVLEEVARVLRPGGQFIFTDPMQADDADDANLQPILDRIHLESLGSPAFYRDAAKRHGLKLIEFTDATHQLAQHYQRVLETTRERHDELVGEVSPKYLQQMQHGLQHWIKAGQQRQLAWGIFHFAKPKD